MVAVASKISQQLIESFALGNEGRGPQQGPDIELRCALKFEQVFGQQDTDDVLAIALENRET